MICHVALCTPPYATLSYLTPEEFPGLSWQAGLRVAVPLGNGASARASSRPCLPTTIRTPSGKAPPGNTT